MRVFYLLLILLLGCDYSGNSYKEKTKMKKSYLDSMRINNSDKIIFLDFWTGMNMEECTLTCNLLTEAGKIKKNERGFNYIFNVGNGEDLLFDVESKINFIYAGEELCAIEHEFVNENYCSNYRKDHMFLAPSRSYDCYNLSYANYLIDLFVQKYGPPKTTTNKDELKKFTNFECSSFLNFRDGNLVIRIMENRKVIYASKNYKSQSISIKKGELIGEFIEYFRIVYTSKECQEKIIQKNAELRERAKKRKDDKLNKTLNEI